jgi:hypothetical protein
MIAKGIMFPGRAPLFALSAPRGEEGRGEVGDSRALAGRPPRPPRGSAPGPLPLPPMGGERDFVAGHGS